MSTPPSFSPQQQAMIYLLSRLDTLHDFAGPRSPLRPSVVGDMIDKKVPQLSSAELLPLLKQIESPSIGEVDHKTIQGIMKMVEMASIAINNPGNINPRMLQIISEASHFEKRAVLFYEIYQDVLGIEIGRFFANDNLCFCHIEGDKDKPTHRYFDKDKRIPSDEATFNQENISVINLGIPDKESRAASGIYLQELAVGRKYVEQILKGFFTDATVRKGAVVDASFVKLELLFGGDFKMLCNIASEWDSAAKSSSCVNIKGANAETLNSPLESEVLRRSVFSTAFPGISLKDKKAKFKLPIGNNTIDIVVSDADFGTDIRTIRDCLETTSESCSYKDQGIDDIGTFFDIKRTGDAYQALMAKQLEAIFVTHDHLAFLKARLNGVPTIFTNKNNKGERFLVLFKPEVDVNALRMRAMREIISLKKKIIENEHYITYVETYFKPTLFDYLDGPKLKAASSSTKDISNEFIFDIKPLKKEHVQVVAEATHEKAILAKHLGKLFGIVSNLSDKNTLHNFNVVKEYIYKFLNYTYLIDIKVKHLNSECMTKDYLDFIRNNKFGLINTQSPPEINKALYNIQQFITKHEDPMLTLEDYVNIIRKINRIINEEFIGRGKTSIDNKKKFLDDAPLEAVMALTSVAGRAGVTNTTIVNLRIKENIFKKIVSTVKSFMIQKTRGIVIACGDKKVIGQINTLVGDIDIKIGGDPEDEDEDEEKGEKGENGIESGIESGSESGSDSESDDAGNSSYNSGLPTSSTDMIVNKEEETILDPEDSDKFMYKIFKEPEFYLEYNMVIINNEDIAGLESSYRSILLPFEDELPCQFGGMRNFNKMRSSIISDLFLYEPSLDIDHMFAGDNRVTINNFIRSIEKTHFLRLLDIILTGCESGESGESGEISYNELIEGFDNGNGSAQNARSSRKNMRQFKGNAITYVKRSFNKAVKMAEELVKRHELSELESKLNELASKSLQADRQVAKPAVKELTVEEVREFKADLDQGKVVKVAAELASELASELAALEKLSIEDDKHELNIKQDALTEQAKLATYQFDSNQEFDILTKAIFSLALKYKNPDLFKDNEHQKKVENFRETTIFLKYYEQLLSGYKPTNNIEYDGYIELVEERKTSCKRSIEGGAIINTVTPKALKMTMADYHRKYFRAYYNRYYK